MIPTLVHKIICHQHMNDYMTWQIMGITHSKINGNIKFLDYTFKCFKIGNFCYSESVLGFDKLKKEWKPLLFYFFHVHSDSASFARILIGSSTICWFYRVSLGIFFSSCFHIMHFIVILINHVHFGIFWCVLAKSSANICLLFSKFKSSSMFNAFW